MLSRLISLFCFAIIFLVSCSPGSKGILARRTAHETYGQKLKDAGLEQTALGRQWFDAATNSFSQPIVITLPFKEAGYFSAEKPKAITYTFSANRGEKINITCTRKTIGTAELFLELWEKTLNIAQPKFISASDDNLTISHSVRSTSIYIVKIQPELLKSLEYVITISSGPSLAYPVASPGNDHIKSLFGVARDGGIRKHEGIDMFATMRTPLLAVSDGTISRVEETPLGGKVIWLKPTQENFSVYYAHLDKHLVHAGEKVLAGDTIGLMGKTGNAASTAPHLHFGIYTSGGAIDPYPFVHRSLRPIPEISVPLNLIGKQARLKGKRSDFSSSTQENLTENNFIVVEAAQKNKYRIKTTNGTAVYVNPENIMTLDKPIRKLTLKDNRFLFDEPKAEALNIQNLDPGKILDVLAESGAFIFVDTGDQRGWVLNK